MALPASGQISLNQVNVELGLSGTAQISMNDAAVRGLFGVASGQISMSDGYGKANAFAFTVTSNTQNFVASTAATAAGWDGSTALVMTLQAGVYLYGTSYSTGFGVYGCKLDVAGMTLENNGYIIGRGGNAEYGGGFHGMHAIGVTANNVTINNNVGAYVAGGGAGGGDGGYGGGGGGAGGGRGYGSGNNPNPGAQGANGYYGGAGQGGGSGGGGKGAMSAAIYSYSQGGGGGRIPLGVGGSGGGNSGSATTQPGAGIGGNGGSAGNPGGPSGNNAGRSRPSGAGGGGWGASAGLTAYSYAGSPGGAGNGGNAVKKNGNTATITNNGTIYGATT